MWERENLKPEEKVKIAKKYLAGEVSISCIWRKWSVTC